MSDELANFFAKKAQKSKDRKKKVNVGEIAERLERSARIQDNDSDDRDKQNQEQQSNNAVVNNEDSEWIENPADDLTNLEELGIKGMVVSELTEEEEVEEEKQEAEPKTWNFEQNGVKEKEESERAEEIAPQVKTKKYVPPINRIGARKITAQPKLDLKSEEMFPTIENAEKIEKELNKNDVKKTECIGDGWKVQKERDRESEKPKDANVTPMSTKSNVYRPPHLRETTQTTTSALKSANKRAQQPW